LSVFNYPTIGEFYLYLLNKKIIAKQWTLHKAFNPIWYNAQILPRHLKENYREQAQALIISMRDNFNLYESSVKNVEDAISFVEKQDTWEQNKELFWKHIEEQDKIRNESFVKTFPELKDMYD
jgi:hypothetical protein